MSFSESVWAETGPILQAIHGLPFLAELSDGSLGAERFRFYMMQDALYLEDYAKALASIAVQAHDGDTAVHFAGYAQNALMVERTLHEGILGRFGVGPDDVAATERSPTCLGYTRFLLGLAHTRPVEVAMAGVLPCFWIYWEVGRTIRERSAADNPYRAWIDAYGDPAFGEKVAQARRLTDRAADATTPALRAEMAAAFRKAAQYEWMFWDSAWRLERWPV